MSHQRALLAFLFVAFVASATAQTTDNLEDLVATNGSLTIGHETFSGFSFQAMDLTNFDPSQIEASLSYNHGNYVLTLSGTIDLTSSSAASGDFLLNYSVTASRNSIKSIDQTFTGSAQPPAGASVSIVESVSDTQNELIGDSNLSLSDRRDPRAERGDHLSLRAPQRAFEVSADVSLALADGGSVSVSDLSESFRQPHGIPEPNPAATFGLGLLILTILLRFRSRVRPLD